MALDLTVITPTRDRPKDLVRVLDAVARQEHALRVEHVVVLDGADPEARRICRRHRARVLEVPHAGRWGAGARDAGIAAALGRYCVFWDDDNLYRPGALATLFAAAWGADLGVCQCLHRGPLEGLRGARGGRIPPALDGPFQFGEVDTLCLCARAEVARTVAWDDGGGPGTDYRWAEALRRRGATVRFVPVVVGEKL